MKNHFGKKKKIQAEEQTAPDFFCPMFLVFSQLQ